MTCSPADKKVHGGVQVLVLDYGCDHQDVLQQRNDAKNEKNLQRRKAGTNETTMDE